MKLKSHTTLLFFMKYCDLQEIPRGQSTDSVRIIWQAILRYETPITEMS